jgi:hypothetical protein
MSSPPRRRLLEMRGWVAQQQHEQERADDGEAEHHEAVNISEHVSLILHGARQQSSRACGSFRVADGAVAHDFRIILQSSVGQKRAGIDVKADKIGIGLLSDAYECLDEGGAELGTKQPPGLQDSAKGKYPAGLQVFQAEPDQ